MRLRSLPKYRGHGVHRAVSPEQTLRRVAPLLPAIGVTRLADITGLDRVGIPTYSAVVPDSRDVLSVYNGKGATRAAARAGAAMEAMERHCALNLQRSVVRGSFRDLSARLPLLHPRSLVLGLHPDWTETSPVAWVEGHDLLTDSPRWVPAQAAAILYQDPEAGYAYSFSTTNGLASGNEMEEAVCHALCELIERDAWTLAELESRYLPEAKRRRAAEMRGEVPLDVDPADWVDDPAVVSDIDISGASPAVLRLVQRIGAAGVELRIKDITSGVGIPTVLGACTEERIGTPLAHFGLGTHPDAEVAMIRALTEVAQSRAVDIQGVREDIGEAAAPSHLFSPHTKRVERVRRTSWYCMSSPRKRALGALPSFCHADVLDDVRVMLEGVARVGVKHVIAVDLTRRELGIPVVRVLAAGLESWGGDHGRLGWRASQMWDERLTTWRSTREVPV